MEITQGAAESWRIAAVEAVSSSSEFIEPAHLFLGLCSLDKLTEAGPSGMGAVLEAGAIGHLLESLGTQPPLVRRSVRSRLRPGGFVRDSGGVHRSQASREMFDRAAELSGACGTSRVSCLALLAACLTDPPQEVVAGLSSLGVNVQVAARAAHEALAASCAEQPVAEHAGVERKGDRAPRGAALARYGRDLTQLAADGKLPPLVGRRQEMLQVVQILGQMTKSNPVLLGEAGVGKTAIVEGLAQRIVEGKSLKGKRIIELNLARIVAGTTYRGQLEERVVQIVDEARSAPNLILFLDEIHALVGAGSAAGGLDVSHILKPALARGEISCIGATTLAEYRRHIETDSALERRFQPVKVVEPTSSEALAMLEGMRPRLQEHHRVTILPEALKAAVDLSVRYIHDRRLPDKALDLIDRACARASTPGLTVVIRDDPNGEGPEVTPILVAEVVSEWADVPVPELASRDGSYLLRIEESLKRRVVGQDDAVGRVAARLQRARAGVGSPNRPAGVFLFIGPSGVGKTELAKALAGALFGSVERMIRIDLSEFQEPHSVSKLIGSPPGYVGYDEEGQLTGRLRTQPHSVVLLDEVEKAHGNVFDLFLQLFDEGRLTDAKGRTAVATSAVFIMTSNLMPPARMGFERESTAEYRAAVISEVRKQFRPEFLNRIDEIVLFRQLGAEDVAEIARRRIAELAERLSSSHGVFLSAEDDALALLADEGLDPASGARGLARVIALRVEEPLSKLILSGDLSRGRSAVLRSTGGGIEVLVSGVEGGERAERGRVPHDRD